MYFFNRDGDACIMPTDATLVRVRCTTRLPHSLNCYAMHVPRAGETLTFADTTDGPVDFVVKKLHHHYGRTSHSIVMDVEPAILEMG